MKYVDKFSTECYWHNNSVKDFFGKININIIIILSLRTLQRASVWHLYSQRIDSDLTFFLLFESRIALNKNRHDENSWRTQDSLNLRITIALMNLHARKVCITIL